MQVRGVGDTEVSVMCWAGRMSMVSMVGQGCLQKLKNLSDFSRKIGKKDFLENKKQRQTSCC